MTITTSRLPCGFFCGLLDDLTRPKISEDPTPSLNGLSKDPGGVSKTMLSKVSSLDIKNF